MERLNLSNLATAVATRRCALFAGAGLTSDSGGATWDDLVNFLKDKFGYSSPLKDNFQIMGDLFLKFDPEAVYETVRERLIDAKIDGSKLKLMGLPWFTTFTTNYDIAFERTLEKNQSLFVRRIVTGKEFVLTGLPSEMLCVKLMGSLDIPFGQPGSMILDAGDFAKAREERGRIFEILASHAANISFLFVGYSFNDGLFLEILSRLSKTIGIAENTYYAVFKEEPNEEKSYLLKQFGVEVIVADLESFAEELSKQVAIRNPADLTLKKIPIGDDIIPINSTKIAGFLSLYNPVFLEDLEDIVSPQAFFKGKTESLKPFGLNWHFYRKEIKEIIKAVLNKKQDDTKSSVIVVEGNPGTGRTFIILAAIHELIKKHRAIAIKIPSYAINSIPSLEDIEELLKEIERASSAIGVGEPERIIFWAEFTPGINTISQFKKLSSNCKCPTSLIFEDVKTIIDELSPTDEVTSIDLGINLPEEQKKELAKYLIETVRKHKFPEINEEETLRIVNEEKQFLPIIYRTLDPARRSINRIIEEEFNRISDKNIQICISFCALSTSIDIEMPVAVLRKALNIQTGKLYSYKDMFEISEGAKAFIKESMDKRTNFLVSIYHSLIAQHIVQLVGASKMDEYLISIAKVADIRSRIEAEFIGSVFIDKGVNWHSGSFKPFTDTGLKIALLEIKNRQPARPIIHHLARLYAKANISDKNIVPLLEEALSEPRELYALEERKENVLTTLANIKWNQKKEHLLSQPREDPDIQDIIALLIQAREIAIPNIHPYYVHARILRELWQGKTEKEKLTLVNEAVEVINEGLASCVDDPEGTWRLNELLLESLSDVDAKRAQDTAKELFEENKDGTGYYTLARIEYQKNSNITNACDYLNKALKAEKYPPGTIALKIEILLQGKSPPYYDLLKFVDTLSSDPRFQDTWKSAYYKAVVYLINGIHSAANRFFNISFRKAPRTLQKNVLLFWMEEGHRKVHNGRIGNILTEREGRIISHNIKGLMDEEIFFDPRHQEKRRSLNPGLLVDFELGFSTRGPIAFDVRPHGRK